MTSRLSDTDVAHCINSGYGSYAIVYLVKEVLYDHAEDESAFPAGDNESYSRAQGTVYGREFALKCLSKRNLSEEQMAVQKFEATLHRSLPKHDNVVALHRVRMKAATSMGQANCSHVSAGYGNTYLALPRTGVLPWPRSVLLARTSSRFGRN